MLKFVISLPPVQRFTCPPLAICSTFVSRAGRGGLPSTQIPNSMKYALRKNPLSTNEQEYIAQIQNRINYDFDRLLAEVTREGSILKDTETEAVMNELFKQVGRLLSQGIGFQSEYFSIRPGIRGTFIGEEDEYDSSRHEVVAYLRAGTGLKAALKGVRPTKTDLNVQEPNPRNLLDNNNEMLNSQLSAGHMHDLRGNYLHVQDLDDPLQGVFLISTENNVETRVSWYTINIQRQLSFKVPAGLLPGSYFLEVRNNFGRSAETLRAGRLKYTLVQV